MEKNIENHTLLLHIGTQKTGTSSLQNFLHDNAINFGFFKKIQCYHIL